MLKSMPWKSHAKVHAMPWRKGVIERERLKSNLKILVIFLFFRRVLKSYLAPKKNFIYLISLSVLEFFINNDWLKKVPDSIRISLLGRDEDLFKLLLPPSTGLLLICMIKKHTTIFRVLQSNQGVAATPTSPKRSKKRIKINFYQFLLG